MMLTKLKEKNQVTIPVAVIKKLGLKGDTLFEVDIEGDHIKLMPVVTVPLSYNENELDKIATIVKKEKVSAKELKPGKSFSNYIKSL
jgi:bifunctional DNA-binding transcriptional regulator/antitoxin component of YhaV-PrlF toxin-antitoxin module